MAMASAIFSASLLRPPRQQPTLSRRPNRPSSTPPPPSTSSTLPPQASPHTTTLHAATIKSNLHSNPLLANALLHAYARCGHPNLASQLFDQMPDRDVVSYTTLVSAHTHNNSPNSAIAAFLNMLTSTPPPNEFTLAAVLQACAQSHNKQLAQVLHAYLLTTGFITDQLTSNSLLDATPDQSCLPTLKSFSMSWVAEVWFLGEHVMQLGTLKNALSPYKLGGAAGGSDFDPKGKSENEIMRFCQSFMDELYRYLGSDKDLPAEDIGVGPREMGYLFGQYKRLAGHYQGSFTGPKIFWSGSSLRTDATAFGLVHFAHSILSEMHKDIKGIRFRTFSDRT